MKKNLSLAAACIVATGMLLGSCVSKRKYMESQATLEQYRSDSAQWAEKSNTLQQNITSLEQKNKTMQQEIEGAKNQAMTQQKRWENFRSVYDQQKSTTEQLHQQVHQAIDKNIDEKNVEVRNGKVYINLNNNMLFTSGSSKLSAKGKETLQNLATVLKDNPDIEVDVITTTGYTSAGTVSSADYKSDKDMSKIKDETKTKSDQEGQPDEKVQKSNEARANIGDSSYPTTGSVTKSKTKTQPKDQGDRNITFRSTPSKKLTTSAANSWNLNVARATSVVRALTESGLAQAGIIIVGGSGMNTASSVSSGSQPSGSGLQIVLSPKMSSYYEMMEGYGSTSKR